MAIKVADNLLSWLCEREKYFNEEIHSILTGVKKVEFFGQFYQGEPVGWLYSYADKDSNDWNLARQVGSISEAGKFLKFLPNIETYLLYPMPLGERSSSKQDQKGMIYWFEAAEVKKGVAYNSILQSKVRFLIKTKRSKKVFGKYQFDYFSAYLMEDEKIIGFVKTIHETMNTCEVYLEISPRFRGRGLGLRLLETVSDECLKRHKKLIYTVASDNVASIRIAEKFGMRKYQTLKQIVC